MRNSRLVLSKGITRHSSVMEGIAESNYRRSVCKFKQFNFTVLGLILNRSAIPPNIYNANKHKYKIRGHTHTHTHTHTQTESTGWEEGNFGG